MIHYEILLCNILGGQLNKKICSDLLIDTLSMYKNEYYYRFLENIVTGFAIKGIYDDCSEEDAFKKVVLKLKNNGYDNSDLAFHRNRFVYDFDAKPKQFKEMLETVSRYDLDLELSNEIKDIVKLLKETKDLYSITFKAVQ